MAEKITEEQVRHVARLSRLRLSDEEVRHLAGQLSDVLGYVSKLEELDVTGVEPMAHAMDVSNVLRDDAPAPGSCLSVEQVLDNAPDKSPPYFKVVKVLGDASGGDAGGGA